MWVNIDDVARQNDEENTDSSSDPYAKYTLESRVQFGSYTQSANGADQTPIEWIILERENDKALLLSYYGLDCVPYNNELSSTTWEDCTLRTWLNNEFINSAFSAVERESILVTDVDCNQGLYSGNLVATGGNSTQDKVFLLSYVEANRYLGVADDGNCMKARASATEYAASNGAWVSSHGWWGAEQKTLSGENATFWWLRSPGYLQFRALRVNDAGGATQSEVNNTDTCIRPAIWVSLENEELFTISYVY